MTHPGTAAPDAGDRNVECGLRVVILLVVGIVSVAGVLLGPADTAREHYRPGAERTGDRVPSCESLHVRYIDPRI